MKHRVNLLPPASQYRAAHRRQWLLWLSVWFLAACALGSAQVLLLRDRERSRTVLAERQQAAAPAHERANELRRIESMAHQLRSRIARSQALEQADVPLALLQVVADSCYSLTDLRIETLRVDEGSFRDNASNPRPAVQKQLLLVGSAAGDAEVTALVSHLRNCDVFTTVELESSQAQSQSHLSRRSFQVRCLE